MFEETKSIYLATRKRHDQVFNVYVMRPLAAGAVAILRGTSVTPNQLTLVSLAIFVVASSLFVMLPSWAGGVIAVAVLEASYLFDCADGMLARHKKLASKEGHLFDFFTDELKATLLIAALSLHLFRGGGRGMDLVERAPGDPTFLVVGVIAVTVVASAISLTNFIRRPELTGKETPVEAHYETVDPSASRSPAALLMTFLRFLNHYPSHLWIFALAGRLDLFFWVYLFNNLAYLGRGWLSLILRFGKGASPSPPDPLSPPGRGGE